MVVCADDTLSYMVSTYTRVRSWAGHDLNTPSNDERWREIYQAFREGKIQPVWKTMHVFYVASHDESGWKAPQNSRKVFHNAQFDVWECPPSLKVAGALPGSMN
jgi:hypothetical protein